MSKKKASPSALALMNKQHFELQDVEPITGKQHEFFAYS